MEAVKRAGQVFLGVDLGLAAGFAPGGVFEGLRRGHELHNGRAVSRPALLFIAKTSLPPGSACPAAGLADP